MVRKSRQKSRSNKNNHGRINPIEINNRSIRNRSDLDQGHENGRNREITETGIEIETETETATEIGIAIVIGIGIMIETIETAIDTANIIDIDIQILINLKLCVFSFVKIL